MYNTTGLTPNPHYGKEIIVPGDPPITASIDRSSDPGRPCVLLEAGCNEFWLDRDEAIAVIAYLQRVVPTLDGDST